MYMAAAAAAASLEPGHETYAYAPVGSSGFVPDGGGVCSAAENCAAMSAHFPPLPVAVADDYGFPDLGVHPSAYCFSPPRVFSTNEAMIMSSLDDDDGRTTSRATGNDHHHHGHRRIGFRTRSEVDVLDDGFRWRKYGKKAVKSSPNPRNYYRCCVEGCGVKKRVERDRDDPRYVLTTYDGVHNHAGAGHHAPPPPAALVSAPSSHAWPEQRAAAMAHSSESSYSR